MSIYEKDSYSTSKCVFLGGPIEFWWGTEENPDMWDSDLAKAYRLWRNLLNEAFVAAGYLVYRPHEAFKGDWNEKMQGVNDYVIEHSDVFVNMTPLGLDVTALGTDHEQEQAEKHNIPVIAAPLPHYLIGNLRKYMHQASATKLAEFYADEVDNFVGGV